MLVSFLSLDSGNNFTRFFGWGCKVFWFSYHWSWWWDKQVCNKLIIEQSLKGVVTPHMAWGFTCDFHHNGWICSMVHMEFRWIGGVPLHNTYYLNGWCPGGGDSFCPWLIVMVMVHLLVFFMLHAFDWWIILLGCILMVMEHATSSWCCLGVLHLCSCMMALDPVGLDDGDAREWHGIILFFKHPSDCAWSCYLIDLSLGWRVPHGPLFYVILVITWLGSGTWFIC
jgi:hypothetical protein